ncbi:MAG: hypothetical protein V7754_04995 [Halioglobus sp.]
MIPLRRYLSLTVLVWTVTLATVQLVQAHLMVAQHGTLNIVNDGAFMVLSLPITAFEGLDDDRDGKVSMLEFNRHRDAIIQSVEKNVTLSDQQAGCSLKGIMLSPVVPHDSADATISQLAVMGRFTLNDVASPLHFTIGLYGIQAAERRLEITATRSHDKQKAVFELTPAVPARVIFPKHT